MLVKITLPRLGEIYPRTRLFQAIDDARQRSIVWISALPGAGKTTLAASYLADQNLKELWYQVDESDADIASFFYYMGLAAKKAAPRRKKSLPLFTPEYALGLPVFTQRYFEQLYSGLKPPFVLVFDNYQTVPADSAFHEVIQSGLELMPDGIQAIIISREDPPPAFARLRANQSIKLIKWDALRLDGTEFCEIVRLNGSVQPDARELEQLQSRTGGWMAGLMLLLETGESGASFDSAAKQLLDNQSPQVVFDYFATEVMQNQNIVTQEFLLQIALLPRITPKIAHKLTGVQQSEKILARMHQNRYFIERHAHNDVLYQFHPLFREFLLARVRQTYSEVELARLQYRAAQVLEGSGQIEEAIELYLTAGDWSGSTRLVCQHAQTLISQGRSGTVTQWIHQIPDAVMEQTPWLQFWLGVSTMFIAPQEGREQLEQAYWQFKKQDDLPGLCMSLACIVDTFSFSWHDFYPLDKWIEELESLLAAHPQLPSPEIQARIAVAMFVALMHRRPNHPDMERYTQMTREIVRNIPGANERVIIGMHLATYYVWWGLHRDMDLLLDELRPLLESDDITPMGLVTFRASEAMYYSRSLAGDAVMTAQDGLKRAEKSGIYVVNPVLLGLAAVSLMNVGKLDAAAAYLAQAATLFHPARLMDQGFYHWNRGHLAWLQGDIPAACSHARQCMSIVLQNGSVFHENLALLTLAKILVEAGEFQEAEEIFDSALPAIRDIRNPALEYECLLAMAKSAFAQHNDAAGLEALRDALAVMRRTGAEMTSWWNPQWLAPLLARALEAEIEVEYVQSLIRSHHLKPDKQHIGIEQWPWPVKIHTLGGFSLTINGEPALSGGKSQKKPIELIKALIAFGSSDVAETQITDNLWPDADGDAARHSLKTTVYRLRKLLGNEDAITVTGGQLSLNPHYCWTDVRAFEQLLDAKNNVISGGDVDTARLDRLERAIRLYKGAFLEGEVDVSWMLAPSERLRNRYLHAVEELGGYREKCNQWDQAIECYETGIGADDLAEPFYQRLIACHAQTGQRGEALSTYERYRKLMSARFGVEPSEKMQGMVRDLKA